MAYQSEIATSCIAICQNNPKATGRAALWCSPKAKGLISSAGLIGKLIDHKAW